MKLHATLRKCFVYLTFLLCAICTNNKIYAANGKFVAAYMYMDNIGTASSPYTYRVYIKLYQKCSGGVSGISTNFNATEPMCWVSQLCYLSKGIRNRNIPMYDSGFVDAYCSATSALNSCHSATSTAPGYVYVVYSDTLTLDGPCTDWIVEWSPRTGDTYPTLTSVNVAAPARTVGDLRTYLDNSSGGAAAASRGSVRFTAPPNFYFCPNIRDYFPTNPVDPQFNPIVSNNLAPTYSNGCLNHIALTTLYYTVPTAYGPAAPFGPSTDPWTVNATTGMCSVTPGNNGDFIVSMIAEAWDPGFSFQYSACECWAIINVGAGNCGPVEPFIDTIPQNVVNGTLDTTGGINKISVCAGRQVKFTVNASKPSSVVHMTYNAKSTPTASVVLINDGPVDSALYSWTPSGTDVGDHLVTFYAEDSTCTGTQTIVSRHELTVLIHVNYSVVAWTNNSYCPALKHGDKTSVPDTLHVSGPPGTTYTWVDNGTPITISCINCTDPTVEPSADGTQYYVSSSIATGCKDSDTVIVHVYPPETFDAGPPITICQNQIATLNPTLNPTDMFLWSWLGTNTWYPGTTLTTATTKYAAFQPEGGVPPYTDSILLRVTDIQKCTYLDTAIVNVVGEAPKLKTFAVPDSVCPQGNSQLYTVVIDGGGRACGTTITGTPPAPATLMAPVNVDANTSQFISGPVGIPGDPNIFEDYPYGGQRQEILYTANELLAAGVQPGYLSGISFRFAGMLSSMSTFQNFTIKMACVTPDSTMPRSTVTGSYTYACFLPTSTVVFPAKNILPTMAGTYTIGNQDGWYKFSFATKFYWDGQSNIVVDMCYAKPIPATYGNDPLYMVATNGVRTAYTSYDYYIYFGYSSPYSGCVADCGVSSHAFSIYGASIRPATAFDEYIDTGLYVYSWSPASWLSCTNCPDPAVIGISKKTTYAVTVYAKSSPGCKSQDSAHIAIDTLNKIVAIPENIIMCRPGYQQLSAMAYGPGPFSNMACGTSGALTCASTLRVPTGARIDNANYAVSPFYEYATKQQFIISRKELLNQYMHSGTIRQMTMYIAGVGFPTYPNQVANFEVRISCIPKAEFTSLSDTIPASQMTLVYSNPSFNLVVGDSIVMPFINPYNWDTTQNLVVQICHGFSNEYIWWVSSTNTTFNSCITYYSYYFGLSICANTVPFATTYSGKPEKARPFVNIDYCPAPSLPTFNYTWKSGTYLSDSSIQSPIAYVNNPGKVTTYTVYTSGRNGCLVHDSVNIYQPRHSYLIFPRDTSFCEGGSARLTVKGTVPTSTYQWYQNGYQNATTLSCTTCSNPVAMPHNTGHTTIDSLTYQLVVTDSVGCSDTVSCQLEVKPIPVVKTLTHDTTINYNGSVQLFATGAAVYTWSPTATLSNPNIVNPIASPKETTVYTVRGLSANGCAATDTVHVDINYHGKVFVPTAFTPNGDGRNDVFKVVNLTFEKILEFHVFNRWGQELFYATDNSGWNGYWHNEPQDIGTYQYLIRVASPDGTIQTFKGDVTLLR